MNFPKIDFKKSYDLKEKKDFIENQTFSKILKDI